MDTNRPTFREQVSERRPLSLRRQAETPSFGPTEDRNPSAEQIEQISQASGGADFSGVAELDAALAAAEPEARIEQTARGPQLITAGDDGGIMEKPEWVEMWLSAHDFAGAMPMINSNVLAHTSQRPNAKEAAGALYDQLRRVPQLHWLLDSKAEGFKAVFLVGGFYLALGREMQAERMSKLKPRQVARPTGQPAAAGQVVPPAPPVVDKPLMSEGLVAVPIAERAA